MQGTLFDGCSTTPHNRERQRQHQRASYFRHHARNLKRNAAYREQHRDQERARYAAYRAQHREKLNARCRAYAQRYPERALAYRLRSLYGLSPSDVDAMLQRQHGCCPSCHREFGEQLRPCIDHDHATGRVRGLLCSDCNSGIGLLGDNVQGLLAAVAYLQNSDLHLVPPK